MGGTPSPPSEAPSRTALACFLAAASGAAVVEIGTIEPLSGGALNHHWGFAARFSGGVFAGESLLVLRAAGFRRPADCLDMRSEFALLRAVFAAGVAVPEPLFASADPAVCGRPFIVMRRVAGTAEPDALTGGPPRPALAERLGRELARLHHIGPPLLGLISLPDHGDPARAVAGLRHALARRSQPRPVLDWALRWLETHLPGAAERALCHRDFRTGNYLVEGGRLAAVLDWEFAGWGDPDEDIGWFCAKAWRYGGLERAAGGLAKRAAFYRGYEEEAGRRIDPERVRFWEIFAALRWALIALQQSDRYILHGERDLDLALTGRRAGESELELLLLLDAAPARPSGAAVPVAPSSAAASIEWTADVSEMRDLPIGTELLALARSAAADRLSHREPPPLLARSVAIATREAAAGDAPFRVIRRDLARFYEGEPVAPARLLRRFAGDLRDGAFAGSSRQEAAHEILWQLTMARLQLANPEFLAAHAPL